MPRSDDNALKELHGKHLEGQLPALNLYLKNIDMFPEHSQR